VEIGVPGYVPKQGETLRADYDAVSPGYFSTLRIPLLEGRDFTDTDNASGAAVAIVNEELADRFWPRESPVGRTFARGENRRQPVRIVGVVRNSRIEDPYSPIAPAFYVPISQAFTPAETLQVRTAGPPEATAPDLLATLRGLAPQVPVLNVRTMVDAVANGDSGFFIFGMGAQLTGALGLLGLALAVVGVYGVMASAVGQRTREIGLRLALGASRGTIVWLVSRHVITILAIGLAAGMSAGVAGGRLAGDFLVGIGPTDPMAYGAALALLSAVALAACYVPTRRALRVDPAIALRND
jgi:putative ABC transport system permease protein